MAPLDLLDHPTWNALTTRQRAFAEGNPRVWRYKATVAPFAETVDDSRQSYDALRDLLKPDDRVALFTLEPPRLNDALEPLFARTAEQMVWSRTDFLVAPEVIALGKDDVPDMKALVDLTKPGPFGPRTHELGKFCGIRDQGNLVAMAGERMKLDGFTEITAVCVHPTYRGRGLAEKVMSSVAREIVREGQRPFLHVFTDNPRALARYRQMGLTVRRRFHATAVVPRMTVAV